MTSENIQSLTQALGIQNAPTETQEKILAMAQKRLEEVVLKVLVANVPNEKVADVREWVATGADIERKVAELTLKIPGLAAKLDDAVAREIECMKDALKTS
ncbi:MAG: hypothetical protein HYS57_01190 [Parcubacteria group bacterium]|nr:hypothetical protein [Parcubacteria group bacterium]